MAGIRRPFFLWCAMFTPPTPDCPLCPRLAEWRDELRAEHGASWHNAPVPSFGDLGAELLIVGLAPGLHGANRTGRPFTGDYAGIILYNALLNTGFARGVYDSENPHKNDGLELINCRISNAVRCVPQENKPLPIEINACRDFLKAEIEAMPNLRAILSLGTVSHASVLKCFGKKLADMPFQHAAHYQISQHIMLIDSYHCSKYNIFTGRMNQAMLEENLNQIHFHLNP